MERTILSQPEVQALLANHLRIKLDLTDNSPEQRAWLTRHQLFGPPAYLFFATNGQERRDLRIQGEVSLEEFSSHNAAIMLTSDVNSPLLDRPT